MRWTRWRRMADGESRVWRAWQSLTSAGHAGFFSSSSRSSGPQLLASPSSTPSSPPSSLFLFSSKMEDAFDGAIGIDLGTTYS